MPFGCQISISISNSISVLSLVLSGLRLKMAPTVRRITLPGLGRLIRRGSVLLRVPGSLTALPPRENPASPHKRLFFSWVWGI